MSLPQETSIGHYTLRDGTIGRASVTEDGWYIVRVKGQALRFIHMPDIKRIEEELMWRQAGK